jgi:ATP-dependent protease ClpP protease subunit
MYQFKAEAAEMLIDGEIDSFWGQNLKYLDLDLQGAKDVKILLNSSGGQVTEGNAIADRLRYHGQNNNVEIVVCGLCASIATMIHAAGSKGSRKMTANSFYMIHNTAVVAMGGSSELRNLADTLDTMTNVIAENYVDVIESNSKLINGSREETKTMILAYMAKETWFSAQQALEIGLIDAIEDFKAYITPESAPVIKNQIRNCTNVPSELMNELNNNITAEEKTLFQKFLAFCGFAPKSEYHTEEKKPDQQIDNLENPEKMTDEQMIEALKAAGYKVEIEAPEEEEVVTEETVMTEEEMMAALEAKGMKVKKPETEAVTNEIKQLREEIARIKQGERKTQVVAKTETTENLTRRERALKEFTAKNAKMLDNAAKSIKVKLNGE